MYMRGQNDDEPGNGAAPEQAREVRADERDRQRDAVADREAHPREQVVDERVAEEALEQREHEHREADQVGQVARLPERAGEEDAQQMQHDRRDEDVRGPVVRLADQQARLDLRTRCAGPTRTRGSSSRRRAARTGRGRCVGALESSKKNVR